MFINNSFNQTTIKFGGVYRASMADKKLATQIIKDVYDSEPITFKHEGDYYLCTNGDKEKASELNKAAYAISKENYQLLPAGLSNFRQAQNFVDTTVRELVQKAVRIC